METSNDPPRWIVLLVLAWLAVFVFSFVQFTLLEPTGSGFTRGLNRVAAWLQWQGAALLLAVGTYFIGRRFASAHRAYRRWSRMPMVISGSVLGLLVVAYIALVVVANVNKPLPNQHGVERPVAAPAQSYGVSAPEDQTKPGHSGQ